MAEVVVRGSGGDKMEEAEKQYPLAAKLEQKPKSEWDTIPYYPASGGVQFDRYFRVGPKNVLQEWKNVDGKDQWVASTVQRYYYADGRVYADDGRCLGIFGVNGDATSSDFSGRQFLETYGTWVDPSGRFVDYYGKNLQFGDQTAIIQLGPPPGLVPVYQRSVNRILVDAMLDINGQVQKGFREVLDDKGYEKLWVTREEAKKFADTSWTVAEVEKLASSTAAVDGYIYADEGRIRFKIVKGSTQTTIVAERKMHHTTNWRGSEGLSKARVAWVVDEELVKPAAVVVQGPGVDPFMPKHSTGNGDGTGGPLLPEKEKKIVIPLLPADPEKGGVAKLGGPGGMEGQKKLGPPADVVVGTAKGDGKPVAVVQTEKPLPVTPVVKENDVIPAPRVVAKVEPAPEVAVSGGSKKAKDEEPVVKKVEPPPPIVDQVQPKKLEPAQPDILPAVPPQPAVVVATPEQIRDAEALFRLFELATRIQETTENLEFAFPALLAPAPPAMPLGVPGAQPGAGMLPGGAVPPGGLPGGQAPGGLMPGGMAPGGVQQGGPQAGGLPAGGQLPPGGIAGGPADPTAPAGQRPPLMPAPIRPAIDGNQFFMTTQHLAFRVEMAIIEPGRVWIQDLRNPKANLKLTEIEAQVGKIIDQFRAIVPDAKFTGVGTEEAFYQKAHAKLVQVNGEAGKLYGRLSAEYRGPAATEGRERLLKIIRDNMRNWAGSADQLKRWEERVLPLLERELEGPRGAPLPVRPVQGRPLVISAAQPERSTFSLPPPIATV